MGIEIGLLVQKAENKKYVYNYCSLQLLCVKWKELRVKFRSVHFIPLHHKFKVKAERRNV